MLGMHLAKAYEIEPRALNRAVERNIERFPEGAVLRLNAEEIAGLKLQPATSSQTAAYSNSISKVKQGGDERTTKTVQVARLGVSEEANTVSPMKWNWNYAFTGQGVATLSSILLEELAMRDHEACAPTCSCRR